jgi:hypothetical protein
VLHFKLETALYESFGFWVSQPKELPLRLLAEPGVNLSIHRAPIAPTENDPRPLQ